MVGAIQAAVPVNEVESTLKADAAQVGKPKRRQTVEESIPRTIKMKEKSPFRVWLTIGVITLLAVIGGLFMMFRDGTPSGVVSPSISASASRADFPATNAIDGDPETIWSSGQDPIQWIMLDLGAPKTVSAIRLHISQFPDGQTVHHIWVGADVSQMTQVHEFRGDTSDPQILEFIPPEPLENVRFIKIMTTQSPSWVAWREIEVVSE